MKTRLRIPRENFHRSLMAQRRERDDIWVVTDTLIEIDAGSTTVTVAATMTTATTRHHVLRIDIAFHFHDTWSHGQGLG